MAAAPSRREAAETLRRSAGTLSTAATAAMSRRLGWFDELSAQERAWVGQIVQAGIRGFVEWYAQRPDSRALDPAPLASSVFGAAPRELTGVITLQQTVELIRLSFRVVEHDIEELIPAEHRAEVQHAVADYAREVAFATAEVYARAAEARGAWDARLEALVVDAILRSEADETVLSRASALGWAAQGEVAVVLGAAPHGRAEHDAFDAVRRAAGAAGMDALCAIQGERLVVVLGGVRDAQRAAATVADHFGEGPVVVGPVAPDLAGADASARAAASAHRAASGWPDAPRPVASSDLLPERALAGDEQARQHLVRHVYDPLDASRGTLLETLSAWFELGASIEATARALFVHPNTVRYRLRQVGEVTGLSPTAPREALTLQVALILGRQAAHADDG